MSTLKEALKCAFLAALVIAVAFGVRIEMTLNAAAGQLPAQITRRMDDATWVANARLTDALALVDKRLGALTSIADSRTGEALGLAKDIEGRIVDPLNKSLADLSALSSQLTVELKPGGDAQAVLANASRATGALDRALVDVPLELGALNATIATTARPIGETAQQLDDAAPLFLDCDHNPDCLFNRYQGVSKSIEKVGVSSQGIASDIKREADQLTKPQGFWGQLKSWLLTFARIYGAV